MSAHHISCIAVAILAACSSEPPMMNEPDVEGPMRPLDELAPNEWNELRVPSDMGICGRGEPFSFFVFPGSTSRVLLHLQGGGACWSDATCDVSSPTFKSAVDDARSDVRVGTPGGILDMTNALNPFGDFTHVYVPYCTGDIHVGDATVEYESTTVQHRGRRNFDTVLGWTVENVPAPDQTVIGGCSAGGYGAAFMAHALFDAYPSAQHIQWADGAAGIVGSDFLENSGARWSLASSFPPWFDPSAATTSAEVVQQIYQQNGMHYPNARLTQYNAVQDIDQVFFYELTGGTGGSAAWRDQLTSSLTSIEVSTANFRYFLGGGLDHCISISFRFYVEQASGLRFSDWITLLVEGGEVENIACDTCL